MRFQFIHINKTAGKSIEKWFKINNQPIVGAEQDRCQRVINNFNSEDFYFTVVRNPYDRIVSNFLHWKNNLERIKPEVEFTTYVQNLNNPRVFVKPQFLHAYKTRFHMPCSHWIKSDKVKIFKFEELNIFKKYFIENFAFKDNLPDINKNSKYDTMSFFNKELLQIINNLMNDDFIKFKYERYHDLT